MRYSQNVILNSNENAQIAATCRGMTLTCILLSQRKHSEVSTMGFQFFSNNYLLGLYVNMLPIDGYR